MICGLMDSESERSKKQRTVVSNTIMLHCLDVAEIEICFTTGWTGLLYTARTFCNLGTKIES